MTWLIYTIITLGGSILWGVVGGWLLYFYVNAHGHPLVPLALYSLVIFASKAINLLVALLVGYVSDHTYSRWGRRLPYIMGGGLLLPVFFYLLWTPPYTDTPTGNLLYLCIILIGFGATFQIHQIPYESLLPELAVDEKQRVRLSTWRTGFFLLGNIVAGFAGPLIDRLGYAGSMWVFAVVAAPTMILPGFFLGRYVQSNPKPVKKASFFAGLKTTLGNSAFQVFILSWGTMWIASSFIVGLIPFIVTEICGMNTSDTVYFYLSGVAATFIALPLVTRLSKRHGVKTVYSGSLLAGAFSFSTLMLIGDWIPIPLFVQGIVWMILLSISLIGAQVLPASMVAEITDHDEILTGHRREGSFYSVWGFFNQVAGTLAGGIIPLFLLLGNSRADSNGPLGVRLLGLMGGILLAFSFWVYLYYGQHTTEPIHITDKSMEKIES